jgi:hypothetical protein
MEPRSTQAHPGAPAEGAPHIQIAYYKNFLYLLTLENARSLSRTYATCLVCSPDAVIVHSVAKQ